MVERLGYPVNARLLIIHADDVGMAHSVDRASFEALEKGWITSASVMVPCPWLPEVAAWAKTHPQADLGIHLTLDSEWTNFRWGPVSGRDQVPSLLDEDGYFPNDPTLLHAKMPEVEKELRAQVDRARQFGLPITHLDSHMLALMASPEYFALYDKLGRSYGLPIRLAPPGDEGVPEGVQVPTDEVSLNGVITMNPGISKENWVKWYEDALRPLKPGIYELVIHLAYDDPEMQGATADHPDWGAAWRQQDFEMVQSAEFRNFLKEQGFVLVGWRDVANRFKQYGSR